MKILVMGPDCAAPEILLGDERLTNLRRHTECRTPALRQMREPTRPRYLPPQRLPWCIARRMWMGVFHHPLFEKTPGLTTSSRAASD